MKNTFVHAMRNQLAQRRATLLRIQGKVSKDLFDVLWGQLLRDEALVMLYFDNSEVALDEGARDLPAFETVGQAVDAIDAYLNEIQLMEQSLAAIKSRIKKMRKRACPPMTMGYVTHHPSGYDVIHEN